jgi:ribosomal protein S18 acetylase RimI-like enzyme
MIEKKKNIENNISISIASIDDVAAIQEVYYKTWLATYPNDEFGITVDDIEDRYKNRLDEDIITKRKEKIANPPEGQKLFVAKNGNQVVGICRAVRKSDRNQLQTIYVLPEYQGKGIGFKLWNEARKTFDENKDTYVEVASYNDSAIAFYKKLGFVETGRKFSDEMSKFKSGSMIPEIEMVIKV